MLYSHHVPVWFRKIFPEVIWSGEKTDNVVHLTFDDGPIPEVTPYILDELKRYNQKATFFCVGDNVRKYPKIYARIIQEGHGVGNHTFHHLNGWENSFDQYYEDVLKAEVLIDSTLFRPPYGKMSLQQFFKIKQQFCLVFWTYLSGDFDPSFDAAKCMKQVKKISKNGAILVFHDNIKSEAHIRKVLPEILEFYRSEHIVSKTLSV
jgi:peptidoglycan/xylan/chitin deacetylase (PgdA/CDA1 family)